MYFNEILINCKLITAECCDKINLDFFFCFNIYDLFKFHFTFILFLNAYEAVFQINNNNNNNLDYNQTEIILEKIHSRYSPV